MRLKSALNWLLPLHTYLSPRYAVSGGVRTSQFHQIHPNIPTSNHSPVAFISLSPYSLYEDPIAIRNRWGVSRLSSYSSSSLYLPNRLYSLDSKMDTNKDNKIDMGCIRLMADRARDKNWPSEDVREIFLSFFECMGHVKYPSSPVIPHADNTLLFINAGMNQFKPIFLGQVDKNSPMGRLRRVVDTQKCIRAGGKHNDLEDVGKDEYHHTFFEMLGNWSFGDYFKSEAIEFAWTLLVDVFQLPRERLYATYFGGDPRLPNCPPDTDARDIWLKYLPKERVLPFGAKENFWEMADVGPCGPCTEIHFDRIGGRDASSLVNMDDPSVLEIWNLVFMQFNREDANTLKPLPSPCVDTGMGLERLVSVLQNKRSNYDTDLFMPIFEKIHSFNPRLPKYQGKVGGEDVQKVDTAYRILADHIRCLAVAVADGAEPANEGRGYVLRRILRRAVRFASQTLQLPPNTFPQLTACVCNSLGAVFPDLLRRKERVESILLREEQLFTKTLDKGVDRFKKVINSLSACSQFPGSEAFTLYATYGFPLDLTQLMAEEEGFTVDTQQFYSKFEEHRLASENTSFKSVGGGLVNRLTPDILQQLESSNIQPTDDSFKYKWSINQRPYSPESDLSPACLCEVKAIWNGVNLIDSASEDGNVIGLILDKTPFYAEQGGQVGDEGELHLNQIYFRVRDTQKSGCYILHIGSIIGGGGSIKVGDVLTPRVNYSRRLGLAQHHTATHLLNAALKSVLLYNSKQDKDALGENGGTVHGKKDKGREKKDRECNKRENDALGGKNEEDATCCKKDTTDNKEKRNKENKVNKDLYNDNGIDKQTIKQRGSLVEEKRLRFDFDWDMPLTNQQIEQVELFVQRAIASSSAVNTRIMPLKDALDIPMICAVFGEVYPDPVRVVSIGLDLNQVNQSNQNQRNELINSSIELCGGTHLSNASQLEDFVIISEESIAKGVRRIVAAAGEAAIKARHQLRDLTLSNLESASPSFPFYEKEVQQAKSFVESNKSIPLLCRRRLLTEIENKQRIGMELSKCRSKELLRLGKLLGEEAAKNGKDKKFIVLNLSELQGDGKALDEAAKALHASLPGKPYLLLSGLESRGTACISFSPKEGPLDSQRWINEALRELGGKGGGKERCVGSAKDATREGLSNALNAALALAQRTLQ